jgi:hypothetical protein
MGGNRNKIFGFEGSQAVPASPSGMGEACGRDSFNFNFEEIGAAAMGRNFEKLTFGGLHEKHAVHLPWDQGKPRKTLIEEFAYQASLPLCLPSLPLDRVHRAVA